MSKTVYKYPFDVSDDVVVKMPDDAEILKVDHQDGQPTIWALVDTESPAVMRRFIVRGTGHPVPDGVEHVGSFFHGPFIWHLFEDPEPTGESRP